MCSHREALVITEWMTAIGTVSAAVVALGLALFHAQISKLLFRPKLNISIETKPPDCNLSTITNTQTMFQSPGTTFALASQTKAMHQPETWKYS